MGARLRTRKVTGCVDGKDTIIQDYAQVDGWQNAEVMDIIAQLDKIKNVRFFNFIIIILFFGDWLFNDQFIETYS